MSYLYTKVSFSQFVSLFEDYGRESEFSYNGLRALFDYLEELAEDTDEAIEMDVLALCCEYAEVSVDTALVESGCVDLAELKDECQVIEVDDDTVIVGY